MRPNVRARGKSLFSELIRYPLCASIRFGALHLVFAGATLGGTSVLTSPLYKFLNIFADNAALPQCFAVAEGIAGVILRPPQWIESGSGIKGIGLPGFEPGISCTRGKRDTKLRYSPRKEILSPCSAISASFPR